MPMFLREAGPGIWPVLLFGILGLVFVARHILSPSRERLPLIIGVATATLLFGILGAVLGVQMSAAAAITDTPVQLFLEGLRESLNNVVAALLFALLHTLGGAYGTFRWVRAGRLAELPERS